LGQAKKIGHPLGIEKVIDVDATAHAAKSMPVDRPHT
jgi:hypothetical protein